MSATVSGAGGAAGDEHGDAVALRRRGGAGRAFGLRCERWAGVDLIYGVCVCISRFWAGACVFKI